MAHRITILPESMTNKIAAGEVVERPASVIKELIENSLDAGASDIIVEFAAGGRKLIKVSDNGHGMSREDALLSLERHATSKLRNESDLDGIATLGFRGEALPSISAVSHFRLATREPGSLEGTEISVDGGTIRDVKACGMVPGTSISVERLFYNTPARLKFMRSTDTESAHIADTVVRMAVSRPEIAFTCINDGRDILRAPPGDLKRRIALVLGKEVASHLHAVYWQNDALSISGFIAGPAAVRSTTAAMFTYINGRFVRDKVVQHAILQAYRGVIDRGRYPVLALFIELPHNEVDVNVHPTKHEVRFRRQSAVHDAIQNALEAVLRASPWLASRPAKVAATTAVPQPDGASQAYRERIAAAAQTSLGLARRDDADPGFSYRSAATIKTPQPSQKDSGQPEQVRESAAPFSPEAERMEQGYFSSLDVIGQFHGEYLLCQSGAELIIIDQHAASERVAYQRLRSQYEQGGVESQRLLFPETLELSFAEAELASSFREQLHRIGFEIEPFGGNTIMLSALPRLAAGTQGFHLLQDILAELGQTGTSAALKETVDALLARIACHSVIRGPIALDRRSVAALLRSMDETDFAASCPHGRPVSCTITLTELEKRFKRT